MTPIDSTDAGDRPVVTTVPCSMLPRSMLPRSLFFAHLPSALGALPAIFNYSLKNFPHFSSVVFNNSSLILVVRGNSSIQ